MLYCLGGLSPGFSERRPEAQLEPPMCGCRDLDKRAHLLRETPLWGFLRLDGTKPPVRGSVHDGSGR